MWNKKYPYTKEEVKDFSSSLFAENLNGRLPLPAVIEFSVELALFWYLVELRYGK